MAYIVLKTGSLTLLTPSLFPLRLISSISTVNLVAGRIYRFQRPFSLCQSGIVETLRTVGLHVALECGPDDPILPWVRLCGFPLGLSFPEAFSQMYQTNCQTLYLRSSKPLGPGPH